MTLAEFFYACGGSYAEAASRFMTDARMLKYINKFEAGTDIEALKRAVASKTSEEAFRQAHTLKGVCLNLCFGNLAHAASELCELYRGKDPEVDPAPYLDAVLKEYDRVLGLIADLNG